jgi:hypothetical protein
VYVYLETEPGVFTVGFYGPGAFVGESDHVSADEAIARMRYLNGAPADSKPARAKPPATPAVKK